MTNLPVGQKVYIFVDFEDGRNYTRIRQDRILEVYTNNLGEQMLSFMYLPCDIPVNELGKTIFIDEEEADKQLKAQLLEKEPEPIRSNRYKLVHPLCVPSLGIGILKFVDNGKFCINEYFIGEKKYKSKNKIYEKANGRKYIVKRGTLYFLDNFRETIPIT